MSSRKQTPGLRFGELVEVVHLRVVAEDDEVLGVRARIGPHGAVDVECAERVDAQFTGLLSDAHDDRVTLPGRVADESSNPRT